MSLNDTEIIMEEVVKITLSETVTFIYLPDSKSFFIEESNPENEEDIFTFLEKDGVAIHDFKSLITLEDFHKLKTLVLEHFATNKVEEMPTP